jgi:hypothetical protein
VGAAATGAGAGAGRAGAGGTRRGGAGGRAGGGAAGAGAAFFGPSPSQLPISHVTVLVVARAGCGGAPLLRVARGGFDVGFGRDACGFGGCGCTGGGFTGCGRARSRRIASLQALSSRRASSLFPTERLSDMAAHSGRAELGVAPASALAAARPQTAAKPMNHRYEASSAFIVNIRPSE